MLLFQVFLYTACQLLLVLLPGWVCRCVIELFGCKHSVGNYVIHSPWHMTPKNLCKGVSARKCILHYGALRHGALYHRMLPWLQYSVSASPFLYHTQGKAQSPSQSPVSGRHTHGRGYTTTLQDYDQQALPQPGAHLGWDFKGGDPCLRFGRSRARE